MRRQKTDLFGRKFGEGWKMRWTLPASASLPNQIASSISNFCAEYAENDFTSSRNRDDCCAEGTARPSIRQKEKAMIPDRMGSWKRTAGTAIVALCLGGLVHAQSE